MTRRMLSIILTVTACAAAGVGPAQAAPGSDTFVEATTIAAVPNMQSNFSFVTCPDGSRVVGGGVDTTGPTSAAATATYVVQLSGPLDETLLTGSTEDGDIARSWFATVFNNSGAPQDFKVFALCSRDSDATIEATLIDDMGPGQSRPATATCPAGKRAVGGGVGTTGPTPAGRPSWDYSTQLSGPEDETGLTANTDDGDIARQWSAYPFNWTATAWDFKVLALCSANSDATVEATAIASLPGATTATATATCPAGRRVLGGGLGTSGPKPANSLNYYTQLIGPLDETGLTANTGDGDTARSFRGAVSNYSGATQDFKVLALCATDPAAPGGGGGGPGGGGPGGGGKPAPLCGGKRATIVGTNRSERITGTRRADVIVALGGNDTVKGGRGKDIICAGNGNDTITGGDGNDRLAGGNGKDRIDGGPGNDSLTGQGGRDTLVGRGGRDTLNGGPGRDSQQQ